MAKPTEQHKAEGTLRADRHAMVPLVIGGRALPRPAPYLTASQKIEFRRIVRELRDGNLLDSADRGLLDLVAIELDVVKQCNRELGERLTVEVTRRGRDGLEFTVTEVSPFLRMREDAVAKLRVLYPQLGIGPAARAALANAGVTGKKPTQALPGVGAKPTPLKAVKGG